MPDDPRHASWFRTAQGRRYFLALAGIVALKITLLLVLYYGLIAPQPRADRSPDALRQHLAPAPVSAKDSTDGR